MKKIKVESGKNCIVKSKNLKVIKSEKIMTIYCEDSIEIAQKSDNKLSKKEKEVKNTLKNNNSKKKNE